MNNYNNELNSDSDDSLSEININFNLLNSNNNNNNIKKDDNIKNIPIYPVKEDNIDNLVNSFLQTNSIKRDNDDNYSLPPLPDLSSSLLDDNDNDIDIDESPLVKLIESMLPYQKSYSIKPINCLPVMQKEINDLNVRINELLSSHKCQLSGLQSEIDTQLSIINHYHYKTLV